MLKHHLITALRAMARQKVQTLILLSGMAIGLTVAFWMFYWLLNEFSYETVHPNAHRIFRVEVQLNNPDGTQLGAATPTPLAPQLEREYPEVIAAARVHPFAEITLHYQNQSFSEDHIMAVDPAFLSMFSFQPVCGRLQNALELENAVILTESVAEKYFGREIDPVGQLLEFDSERRLAVTAVIRDLPNNTHLNFDILIPLTLADRMGREFAPEQWHRFDEINTYIQLADNASWRELENKIAPLQAAQVGEGNDRLYLQPLKEIHFATDVIHEFVSHTDKRTLYRLTLISFLVLIMACNNFITLISAMTLKRRTTIELRKVYGANRTHIMRQLLTEAFLYTGFALIGAVFCIELSRPLFTRLIPQTISYLNAFPGSAFILILGLAFFMGILVGIIPAIGFSRLKTTSTLRNAGDFNQPYKVFQPLILLQFILTISLITGTVVVRQQLNYMQHKPPGYDRAQIISVPMTMPLGTGIRSERFGAFRSALMRNPSIQNVTMPVTSPEDIATSADDASWSGQPAGQSVMVQW